MLEERKVKEDDFPEMAQKEEFVFVLDSGAVQNYGKENKNQDSYWAKDVKMVKLLKSKSEVTHKAH